MNDQNSNTVIEIGNPLYDSTFNDLFGPDGSVFEFYGGKERFLSFIQDLFPSDQIYFIEYIFLSKEDPDADLFDLACRCYDKNGNFIYDVEVQRHQFPSFIKESIFNPSGLLHHMKQTCATYDSQHIKVRIISFYFHNIDKNKPGLFQVKKIKQYKNLLTDHNTWTFIQLPKLLEEGTDIKWLQILSAGAINKKLVSIDSSKFNGDAYKSGLKLLESYNESEKYKKLKAPSFYSDMVKDDLLEAYNDGYLDGITLGTIDLNRFFLGVFFDLFEEGTPLQEISNDLTVDTNLINVIISIGQFWDYFSHLNISEPTDKIIEEEIRKFFNFPE